MILELAYSPTPLPNGMMVPLCFLFHYKGFIGLVEANYEFSSQNLVYGKKENDFYQSSAIQESLSKLGKSMRIRPHQGQGKMRMAGDISNLDIMLSQGMSVYKPSNLSLEDLVKSINPKLKTEMEKLKISNIRVSDASRNPLDFNTKSEAGDLQTVYYMKDVASILPLDMDISKREDFSREHRLRPEFSMTYEKKLNPDVLIDGGFNKQNETSDFDISEAKKAMMTRCFAELLRVLDSLEYIPIDSEGIALLFHEKGVNLRYLG